MVTIDDFSRIVSALSTSAIHPENWVVAMAELARTLDAMGGGVLIADGTAPSIMTTSMPQEATTTYGEYYRHIDYVLAAVERSPAGLIRSGSELIAMNADSEFNNDWMRRYQLGDGLFVRLAGVTVPTYFVITAPKRSEPFATTERIKLVSAVVPHVQQALRTQEHIKGLTDAANGAERAFDLFRHGIAIVAPGQHVVRLNSAAEHILKSGDGLRIRSGIIEAACANANAELRRSIAGPLLDESGGARSGNSFVCARPSGKRPYVIHVLPFVADHDESEPRAMLVVIDPEQRPEPPPLVLRRLYGFTKCEADIALHVLRGEGLKPISEELSLSMATIKTHLQRVFEKTNTHRQAELIRLLLAIMP